METTKDRRNKNRLNDKIKYCTRLQAKNLNQRDLAKIKKEEQETKNIKTKVNKQLLININDKTPHSCESLINLIVPSTNEQSTKIPNDKKRKNLSESLMERKKNKKSRKSNYQPFLKNNNKYFNISLDDIYYKNNFILTHSFNIIEFLDSFKFLPSPEVKVLDQTYDGYCNNTISSCLDNYLSKPDDCIKKENDVHNLEQSIYINKNNSDNNHDLNIFKLLLLRYWSFYDFNTLSLFFKVNESIKSETNYSEMLETDIISATDEIYSKSTTTKEASLLGQLLCSEISGISEYEKACFLYDSFSFKTRKIYSLITKIAKVQTTQNSNSKMIDMKKTSKIFTKLFKMETLLSPHEIYFEITYMGKGLSLSKTYSEVTTKFKLSLPIIYFKKTKKKVFKKLDLSLNELLYSKLAKTKQDSPADKLYIKVENTSFSYSNLIELLDKPHSQLETFFNFTVIDRKYYLKTYSRKNLKKKLPLLKSYSKVIVHSKIFLLRTFSKKNLRDQQNLSEIYNTLSEVTKEEKCIKNASNINPSVITQSNQVIRIANEDNTEQLNHNLSSSDTTHLIGSDSCLSVGGQRAITKQTSIKNLKKRACIVTTCEQTVSCDFCLKWMNTLKSLLLINKINLRVQTNEEKATHKIPVCNKHYEQILLITQCQLCGNQTIQKFHLHKSEVHKYQSVLNEDEIPVTIKYDNLICKSCYIYLFLQGNITTKMSFELEKLCDAYRIRIINHYRLKSNINNKKTEEDDHLLLVKSLPTKKRNIFTPDSSMVLKPVSSAIEFVNTTTTVITTKIGTKPLMTTKTMSMAPMSTVVTSTTENLSPLGFNQKIQPTFLDTHPSVPRTIKRPVTTNYRKHSMTVQKLTIPDHRITIPVEKPVSPIDRVDRSMTQIKKTKTRTSKPMIPVEKYMTLVNKSTISVDKPMIADHKPNFVFTQNLKSIFTSELSVPKENVKTPNSVSPIKIPTIVETDQSLNNSFDLRSKSPLTEFPKSSRQQASKFLSTIPDIIQFYQNLKTTYPNGKAFINNLMKLETYRNLGFFTVQNYETIHHQQKSCTVTTPPNMMNLLKPKEYQTSSRIYNYNNGLTDNGYLDNKCVISKNDKGSDSLVIPVKTTYKSYNKSKLESISLKNVTHKPSQHNDNGDSKKQAIALRSNATDMPIITTINYPAIPIPMTTITTTTTETLANVVCATSPIFSTISEAITANEVLTTIEMDSTATNTSALITAVAGSTATIMNTKIPVITDTVTITSGITYNVNGCTTIAKATDLEESTTTNIASAVSSTIDADSITAITTTVIHDTYSAKINSESSTIPNLISTEFPIVADEFTTINATTDISGVTTTTAAISTTTISIASQCTSNENSVNK